LKTQGYRVLTVFPQQVSVSKVQEKLGFVVTISSEKAKELIRPLGSGLPWTVDIEFGIHQKLAVFSIKLRNDSAKYAILYFVYYHTSLEWLIEEEGKKGFYIY
jgi:hypothetical protein